MRFGDLEGLTSLPIERVRHRFRNEDVLAVLPVTADVADRDALLVATALKLAVVTGDTDPESPHWMSRWAPWDVVRLTVEEELAPATDRETYGLTIHVGGLVLQARLPGLAGQRALRDFVVMVQARHEALVPAS
jgi:hypothetical protein